ncbi:glutamate-5-semialdehyde dehydrogenase [Salinibacterium sp. NSLL150]|uniref:glutamate-5-semialdehyde dehydrogenase n=1 Tax=unclassified Salinibacterium TaxID=2632331 RepID=UPI0018CE55EF|nr:MULTISPECIES: glutamate-5-semialdehyde dehydrogenase [unclassified Salinibacterium]MBH0098866.1 glutamate-5-semialdehyde dehydrogenase [Salinibacterium sp. NSLL35]MBH0101621.1 glutamate-5-semialdehyde dehydrogenase [Salinibacterium sp. NSLL150]MBH0104380.1 glutamate-5-semialdehyde dehydrogenase [Salinibacterium sp. NSLL16]MBH0107141.1 glutamate-5-semialdehyde dehydrogenase [Salinibacterium sp. NSLL17]
MGDSVATALSIDDKLRAARAASRTLATVTTVQKNAALEAIAAGVVAHADRIVEANARDLERGRSSGMTVGLQDRLRLTPERIAQLSAAVLEIVELADPVGTVVRGSVLPNGLSVAQTRVPFGVIGAIYEARPNVTIDIAALALKSGNAVLLRGGSAAEDSNRVLVEVIQSALSSVGIDPASVQTVDEFGREGAKALMQARGFVDVLIPRGSAQLIQAVVTESTVPVIETGAGIVHIFLDESADETTAVEIVHNAKVQRPSVCNALETLLVHERAAERLIPAVLARLAEAGVTIHADERTRELFPSAEIADVDAWSVEHLSLDVAVRVVADLDAAIEHIDTYSTKHTESIITNDLANADRFLAEVDSAVVMVNASTRFTDGAEFGFGAEVGISTQKLHARGPMGLPELTSTKWVVRGSGQVRG